MNISLNWLKDFVTLPKNLSTKELQERLTLASVEVEGVIDLSKKFDGVIVAQILEVSKHPQADKLQIAKVYDGKNNLQIVCGAPNIAAGQKVPLATLGTFLPAVEMTIEKRPVRGVDSEGMLCAADELGLGTDHAGIIILDDKAVVGTSLAKHLGLDDVIFEIDNKSMTHRPDMWSHYGMARELSALLDIDLKKIKPLKFKTEKLPKIKVAIEDKKLCPRYMAVRLDGVSTIESPEWLKDRLNAVGQQPINAIVDVVNYVMFEFGQPMHTFDANTFSADGIIIRRAKKGEKVTSLDDKSFELSADDLVIANNKEAVAIAGVKGLKNSGISNETNSIIIESANFEHVSVRKTSQRLGLRTDASTRYEKSLDPNLAEVCLNRALELFMQIFPKAKITSQISDSGLPKLNQGPINVSFEYINTRIGQTIPAKKIISILTSLGFEVKATKDKMSIKVPTWRATKDIEGAHDIVEEVARIYGYNEIKPSLPKINISRPSSSIERSLIEKIKNIMAYGFDATEFYGYSFIGEKDITTFGEDPKNFVSVSNPLAVGLERLRRELLPGMILEVSSNERNFDNFNIFEISKVFRQEEKGELVNPSSKNYLPKQDNHLACLVHQKGEKNPYSYVKNILEVLLHQIHIVPKFIELQKQTPWLDSHRLRYVEVLGKVIGVVSELDVNVRKSLKIKENIGIFEINISALASLYKENFIYRPIPKYPAIDLDISLELDRGVLWAQIEELVRGSAKELIKDIKLFDVYEGENLESGKKSIAFRINYRSDDKTLEMKEVEKLHQDVKELLVKNFGAKIR